MHTDRFGIIVFVGKTVARSTGELPGDTGVITDFLRGGKTAVVTTADGREKVRWKLNEVRRVFRNPADELIAFWGQQPIGARTDGWTLYDLKMADLKAIVEATSHTSGAWGSSPVYPLHQLSKLLLAQNPDADKIVLTPEQSIAFSDAWINAETKGRVQRLPA
jgi:hypothetical protein